MTWRVGCRTLARVRLLALMVGLSIAVCGCASLERGGVYYEASSPEAKVLLAGRIETLRTALQNDSRLVEEKIKYYPLRFHGVRQSEFDGFWVTYSRDPKDSSVIRSDYLVIACPYDKKKSEALKKLLNLIDTALGPDLMKLLKVDIRYTLFS